MSKGRRALLTKLIEQEKRTKHVIVPLATWCIPPDQVPDGTLAETTLAWATDWAGCAVKVWVYRVGDLIVACTPLGHAPTEAIEAHLHARMAGMRKLAARVPTPPADPAAARARIAEIDALLANVKNSPSQAAPSEPTLPPLVHWTRCGCGEYVAKGSEATTCPRCRAGV